MAPKTRSASRAPPATEEVWTNACDPAACFRDKADKEDPRGKKAQFYLTTLVAICGKLYYLPFTSPVLRDEVNKFFAAVAVCLNLPAPEPIENDKTIRRNCKGQKVSSKSNKLTHSYLGVAFGDIAKNFDECEEKLNAALEKTGFKNLIIRLAKLFVEAYTTNTPYEVICAQADLKNALIDAEKGALMQECINTKANKPAPSENKKENLNDKKKGAKGGKATNVRKKSTKKAASGRKRAPKAVKKEPAAAIKQEPVANRMMYEVKQEVKPFVDDMLVYNPNLMSHIDENDLKVFSPI